MSKSAVRPTKRPIQPRGQIGPASFPRTHRGAEPLISEEERQEMALLRQSLSFENVSPSQHIETLPEGVSQAASGTYRYESPLQADVDELQEKLIYFQTMRQHAEKLAAQLQGPLSDSPAAAGSQEEQVAQLLAKKEQLDQLQEQLQFLRQAQKEVTEGFDEMVLSDPTKSSPKSKLPDRPPPPPPASKGQNQNESTPHLDVSELENASSQLQELENKKAHLEALRSKLSSLAIVPSEGTSTDDLASKKELLENLKGQLDQLSQERPADIEESVPDVADTIGVGGDNEVEIAQKRALLDTLRNQLSQLRAAADTSNAGEFVDEDIDDEDVTDEQPDPQQLAILEDLQQKMAALSAMKQQLQHLTKIQESQNELAPDNDSGDDDVDSTSAAALSELEAKRSLLNSLRSQLATLQEQENSTPVVEVIESDDDVDAAALADLQDKRAKLERLQAQLADLKAGARSAREETVVESQQEQLADLANKRKLLEGLQSQLSDLRAVTADPEKDSEMTQLAQLKALRDTLLEQKSELVMMKQLQGPVAVEEPDFTSETAWAVDNSIGSYFDNGEENLDEEVALQRDEAELDRLLREREMLQEMLASVTGAKVQVEELSDSDDEQHDRMKSELAELKNTRSALKDMKNDLLHLRDKENWSGVVNDVENKDDKNLLTTAPADLVRQRLASLRALAPPGKMISDALSEVSTHGSMHEADEPDEVVPEEPSDQLLPRLKSMMDEMRRQQIEATHIKARHPDLDTLSLIRAFSSASVRSDTASISMVPAVSIDVADAKDLEAEKLDEVVELTNQSSVGRISDLRDDGVGSLVPEDGSVSRFDPFSSKNSTSSDRPRRSVAFSDGSPTRKNRSSSNMDELSASNVQMWHQLNDLRKEVGMLSEFIRREPKDNVHDLPAAPSVGVEALPVEQNQQLHVTIPHYSQMKAEVDAFSNARAFSQADDESESGNQYGSQIHDPKSSPRSRLIATASSESIQQNMRLATLYAESLPVSRRAAYLKSFAKFQNTHPDKSFQYSMESFASAISDESYSPDRESTSIRVESTNEAEESSDFDAMKDAIYREVAVFIACNEKRPNFLLSFFHIIQCLTSDFLRDQALHALQELVVSSGELSNSVGEKYLDEITEQRSPFDIFASTIVEDSESNLRNRPGSAEHRNRSYDYEEIVQSATDVQTPGSSVDENGHEDFGDKQDRIYSEFNDLSVNEGLAKEFQSEIEGNKEVVLELSQYLDQLAEQAFSKDLAHKLTALVEQLILNSSQATGSGDDAEVLQQLIRAVRKVFERNIGKIVSDSAEDVLRGVSDILYDVMIFNKVIQQVDKSYSEEISELQHTQDHLDNEVNELQHQRNEDLARLMTEQLDRLGKSKWSDEEYDNIRDDEFANHFEVGDVSMHNTSVTVELTPAEAKLLDESDEDEITLDDLPDTLQTSRVSEAQTSTQTAQQVSRAPIDFTYCDGGESTPVTPHKSSLLTSVAALPHSNSNGIRILLQSNNLKNPSGISSKPANYVLQHLNGIPIDHSLVEDHEIPTPDNFEN